MSQNKTNAIEQIHSVAVIGAGQMGAGIAQVLVQSGLRVSLFDSIPAGLERGMGIVNKGFGKLVEKEKLSKAQAEEALKLLTPVKELSKLADSDLIIEAIVENTEAKLELFKELDKLCKPTTLFASNTSSISITKLASVTKRPEKVIGMHFMNPVPVMKLVEVICGLQTSPETLKTTTELVGKLGKTPIQAHHDYPGFVVNRILIPMINEAIYVLMEGIAEPEAIDVAMKLGTNQPMGPLELADFVGLDTCLSVLQIFHREFGDDKYRPCPLLVKYVEAGWYGRKSGRGFYTYNK